VASLALVVPATGRRHLIDVTPDIRDQLDTLPASGGPVPEGVDRAPVDGALLTHAHIGHYLGLAQFGFEAVHTRGLPVRATPRMARFLRDNAPWNRLLAREEIVVVETEPGATYEIEPGIRVTPLPVPHRDEDSDTVGYRISGPARTILYVPDTDRWSSWSPSLLETIRGCDVALLDGTFYSAGELPGRDVRSIGHPLVTETMDLLESRVRAREIAVYFTHFNHSNPLVDPRAPERAEVERRGFGIAIEGQRLPI
jgi:pyrroloquinoline quinone biosynthesis protein B